MTREEAKNIVEQQLSELLSNPLVTLDEKYVEAEKMAIKALEKEPCDDAISRSATLDAIIKRLGIKNETYLLESERVIYQQILAMPPVTPQPKMGQWIMSDDGLYRPICNNCGAHPWKGYIPTVEEATEAFKYCPHCGYAMQGVEE